MDFIFVFFLYTEELFFSLDIEYSYFCGEIIITLKTKTIEISQMERCF